MIGSLVPGFKGHGSPVKQLAAEERRRRRREEDERAAERQDGLRREDAWRRIEEHPAVEEVSDAAGEGAMDPRIRRPYTPEEMAKFESIRSARYETDDPEYHHSVPEARDAWEAAERLGSIAPVLGNPSLDPASGDLIAVSYMCGFGGEAMIGHDAMDGVDRYVTGEADANENLRVEGHHGGPVLQMAPGESVMRDDLGFGDLAPVVPGGPAGDTDWDLGLRVHEDEGPMSGGWTDWL